MTTAEQKIQEFREKFVEEVKLEKGGWAFKVSSHPLEVEQWLESAFKEIELETAEDTCELIDDIEMNEYSTSLVEWKMFKRIRNTIRNKYLKGAKPDGK